MMQKLRIVSLVLLLFLLSAISPVSAQETFVVDQANDQFSPGLYQSTIYLGPIGQEFTPSLYALDAVEVYIEAWGSTALIHVRSASISGPILGTSETVTLPAAARIIRFNFPRAISLVPGNIYVLEVVGLTGNSGVGSSGGPYSTYPLGRQYVFGVPQDNNDLWFREGIAHSIPASKDQCKSGGWRNLVRTNGVRFTNQGDCIRFVNAVR